MTTRTATDGASATEGGGEGGNRTHPSTQSAGATILKTVTTTRHVSLSAPILTGTCRAIQKRAPEHALRRWYRYGFQLRISVIGEAVASASVTLLTRNRPSRETAY